MPENEMTGNLFLFARSEPNASAMTPQPETIKPEARLVERIASGDEEAFGELYKMFAPLVHASRWRECRATKLTTSCRKFLSPPIKTSTLYATKTQSADGWR
jgi:hypothetical protein